MKFYLDDKEITEQQAWGLMVASYDFVTMALIKAWTEEKGAVVVHNGHPAHLRYVENKING